MSEKQCTTCKTVKPFSEFWKDSSKTGRLKSKCITCLSVARKQWLHENRDKRNAYRRKQRLKNYEHTRQKEREAGFRNRRKIKQETFEAYGNKCACCGETQMEFLTIDHTNNDGAEHRRKQGISGGMQLYRWLKRNGFPRTGFQLLCFNCNCAKGIYGKCPHEV